MKNRIDASRRKTPWDNEEQTVIQKFISRKYMDNYKQKHPKLSETDESVIINSIEIKECHYCHSKKIIKRGKNQNKIQRYYCNDCKKRFTPITGTIFENHKISITEWIEFLLDIFNYSSTNLTSKVNKNSINTSNYWLHKVFLVLKDNQKDTMLKDKFYIDEMFYSVMKSDIQTKNGKKLRGLSHNQYCIGIGYDGTNIIAIVEGFGKPSEKATLDTFASHLKRKSHIIHDDEKAHHKLVNELELENESYNSNYLKKLSDEDNPLRPINHQCDLIRQFLNTHSGFDRDDLQDYLNLYCFMNSGHKKKLEKVEELLILSLNASITLKYRELYSKSPLCK